MPVYFCLFLFVYELIPFIQDVIRNDEIARSGRIAGFRDDHMVRDEIEYLRFMEVHD